MRRILVTTLTAITLVAVGAFVAGSIHNPLANSYRSSETLLNDTSPIIVKTEGAQIMINPVLTGDGKAAPLIVNVGTSQPTASTRYHQDPPRQFTVVERTVVQPQAVSYPSSPVKTGETVRESRNRSWQKEALIIGGSAAAGAGIGAVAGGKKGAAIGAISGGVAGLVYDIATR